MKLDSRGFPKRAMPAKDWVAWAIANVAPEDFADFFASQARLWKRKGVRWTIAAIVLAVFVVVNTVSLIIDLIGGAA